MTKQELTDLLKKELKQGEVSVSIALANPQCRIDWYVKGLDLVVAFSLNIHKYLMQDDETIKEGFIKPTVLILKTYMRKIGTRG